jgi:hypothetical protein
MHAEQLFTRLPQPTWCLIAASTALAVAAASPVLAVVAPSTVLAVASAFLCPALLCPPGIPMPRIPHAEGRAPKDPRGFQNLLLIL